MNSDHGAKPSGQPHQSAGDIFVSGQENPLALTNAGGDVAINQSRQVTIYNYYYREESRTVPVESAEPDDDLPCPYRGLFHFGPSDAEFFFGREVFVTDLLEAVETRAFVPVLGASGSGKSSVVFAGLVPRLQQTGHWLFTHFRPGEDPFHGLALALVPLYAPNLDETDQIAQARKLANYLRNQDFPLTDAIAQIQQNCPNQRVLLIADQFEELYTLCKDDPTRRQFLDCLLACLPTTPPPTTQPPLVLVATMRADFLGSALAYRPFADVLQAGDIKLGAMNREELADVIEKPAAKLGVTFEPGLVKRILDAVDQQPGNLPLLEFALTELWKRRHHRQLTHAAYEDIGKVQGALARYADEQYARLSETEKDQVRRIFVQLVRPGEGAEDTRRLATKAELGEDQWALVKRLADTRLVVTSQDETKQETVEVVHEALIRNWGELRGWMTTDREFRTWQERLRGAMQQWEATNQDEGALLRGAALAEAKEKLETRREDLSEAGQAYIQASVDLQQREQQQREEAKKKQLRQTQRAAVGLGAIALVAIGAGAWAWVQQQRATTREVNAQFLADSLTMETYLEAGLEEEAVTQAMRTGQALNDKKADRLDPSTRFRAISSIREVMYGVKEQERLIGHNSTVWSVAFSPDGETIATASGDKTVKLWSRTGEELQTLKSHSAGVNSVAFSPDGETIATASDDNTVKLWSRAGEELQTLMGHSSGVLSVAFSLDGETLATASGDHTVKLWNFELEPLITRGCNWLDTYFVKQSPELLMELETCQQVDPSLTAKAAPMLVKKGLALARDGKSKDAIAYFQQVIAWDNSLDFNPRERVKTVVAANKLVIQAKTLAEAGKVTEATTKFAEAKELDPSLDFDPETRAQQQAVSSYLIEGRPLLNSGDIDAAVQAYRQAETVDMEEGISPYDWNALCWVGSTYNQAEKVTFACDKAVALAPDDGYIIGSRGLARALTGDTQGAIADFKTFIESTSDEDAKAQRQGWVNALQKGENPFTPEVLEAWRNE